MAKKNKLQKNSSTSHQEFTVLSIDKMGRVITNGDSGFAYGVLLPQNILVNSANIPIENAISFVLRRFSVGAKIMAKVDTVVDNKQGISIALLSMDVPATENLSLALEKLEEGEIYEVVVDDIQSDYYCLSVKGSLLKGFIECSAFDSYKPSVGSNLRLRLDLKGDNCFQYVHFITIDDSKDIQAIKSIELTDDTTQELFDGMFSSTERNLLPEEDIEFSKKLIRKYPNLNRKDCFLDDLLCLYCRYDAKLEIVISSFNKYNPTYLTDSSYWVKYYKDKEKDKEYLLLFNSDDIVILISLDNNTLVIKELYYNRTNQAAMELLEENKDACLKLDGGKLHILNKYQSIPHGFSPDDVLDYILGMQSFHNGVLKDLRLDVIDFRKDNAKEFDILRKIIEFEKDNEIKKSGEIIYINKESNIVRTASTIYKSGIAFHFDMSSTDYSKLVNDENEDNIYVSITDEEGKPLRSGLLTYDSESKRACLEFPNKEISIDSSKVREGFHLKKRNTVEHYELQMNALTEFTKNRGTSFYDDMMSGSLPVPVITEEIDKIEFFDENLQDAASDNNQPLAVKRALGNQKITLIQGPPGTGKTTVIVEIIRQLVKQGKKVLVCSQAHAAVDNIVEKLKKIPVEEQEIISMSIGNEGEEESWGEGFNSEDYKLYLHNNAHLIDRLRNGDPVEDIQQEIETKYKYSNSIAKQYKASHEYILNYYSSSEQLYENSDDILNKILYESDKFSYSMLEACRYQTMDVILGTCIGIGMNKILRRGTIKFDTVIIDEAAKANLAESVVPLNLGERFVLVGDDKQLPPYSDPELIDAYIKRITLKGKEILNRNDVLKAVTTSLFQKVHESEDFPPECLTMLNYQYRMHPDIGELISKVFYEGKVNMGKNTPMQQISLSTPFNEQVTFIDTNRGDKKYGGYGPYERFVNNSYCNDLEVEIICDQVLPVLKRTIDISETSIGIITPYRAQRDLLKHYIKDCNYRNCVYTIDSIQGREFDIVIFSFVRAFKANSTQKVGFLDDMRRLNVSLSRAKKKLILIGHKATLTDERFHADQDVTNIKPHEVFSRLSESSITFSHKTKADIFVEKYHVGDTIPCLVDSVTENMIYVIFKNDTIFYYPIYMSNASYLEAIKEAQEVDIKFKRYNSNKKPQFDIVSFTDRTGKKHDVVSIESYQDIFPLGKEVTVQFVERDERGDVRVQHYGFKGKFPRNTYPDGYFESLHNGQNIKARVYYIDLERQIISFCPIIDESIVPYILDGQIKNFCCKVIDKPSVGNVELEFDGGYSAIFNIHSLWYNFLEIGKVYTSIGYDILNSRAFVFRGRYFPAFVNKYSIGDHITGKLVHKGIHPIAIADNYPGFIVAGNLIKYRVGATCDFIIHEINEEQQYVNFILV